LKVLLCEESLRLNLCINVMFDVSMILRR
jgi:hypothetical protein